MIWSWLMWWMLGCFNLTAALVAYEEWQGEWSEPATGIILLLAAACFHRAGRIDERDRHR